MGARGGQPETGRRTVWEDLFDADGAAYEAFEAAVEQEDMGAFLDKTELPTSPSLTRH